MARIITYEGGRYTIQELADRLGMSYFTLYSRLQERDFVANGLDQNNFGLKPIAWQNKINKAVEDWQDMAVQRGYYTSEFRMRQYKAVSRYYKELTKKDCFTNPILESSHDNRNSNSRILRHVHSHAHEGSRNSAQSKVVQHSI